MADYWLHLIINYHEEITTPTHSRIPTNEGRGEEGRNKNREGGEESKTMLHNIIQNHGTVYFFFVLFLLLKKFSIVRFLCFECTLPLCNLAPKRKQRKGAILFFFSQQKTNVIFAGEEKNNSHQKKKKRNRKSSFCLSKNYAPSKKKKKEKYRRSRRRF